MMTVYQRVADARERLRRSGIGEVEADLGARVLAEHLLGWDAATFFTSGSDPEPAGFGPRYESLVARRASREPLPYITGVREFWHLEFEVTPAVLIPRPETEFLVEVALGAFPSRSETPRIVDACTGCGCVAVAIACERPGARIIATDISPEALAVARRNAERHHVADRVRFVQADLFTTVNGSTSANALPDNCDLIVANPPYVAARSRPALQPEVRDHEPGVALYGGEDGLEIVKRVVQEAPAYLRAGGYLAFEFGYGQDVEVERLLSASAALDFLELRHDLQGIARTAVTRRR